jgi:transcription initiation factor TFIIIB Brf1 subunit/transcription initiation factor TFIIB
MAEKKVMCPECDKDVTIKDGEGVCANCGLDVGWCLEKARRDKAVRKLSEPEKAKKKGWADI